jgi:hypothetical protein
MPLWLDRLTVAITLVAGFGTAAVAALHLRRERQASVRAVPGGAASAVRADQV